jgi:hypothetical protein
MHQLTHGYSRAFFLLLESYDHVVNTRFLIDHTRYFPSHKIAHFSKVNVEFKSLLESVMVCCTMNVTVEFNEGVGYMKDLYLGLTANACKKLELSR